MRLPIAPQAHHTQAARCRYRSSLVASSAAWFPLLLIVAACSNSQPSGPQPPPTPHAALGTQARCDAVSTASALHVGINAAGTWLLLPLDQALQFEPILHDHLVQEGIVLLDGLPVGVDTSFMTVEDALRKIRLVGNRLTVLAMPQSLICSPPVRDAVAAMNLPRLLVELRRPGEQGEALVECLSKLGAGQLHLVLDRPTQNQIQSISRVNNVTELHLQHPQSGMEAIAALGAMPRLQTLALSGVLITPRAWLGLLSLRFLKILDLGDCRLGESKRQGRAAPEAFQTPEALPTLAALIASDVKGELAPLSTLLSLLEPAEFVALGLPGTPGTPDQTRAIQRFTNLRLLHVGHASTEPLDIDFSALAQLTSLDLYGCKILPGRIPGIATLKGLKNLCLTGSRLGDDEALQVLQIRGLESLHLGETSITDAVMPEVAKMPALKALYLPRTGITDTAVKSLSGNRLLRRLALTETKITDNSGVYLGRMKSLVSLVLEKTAFGNIGAAFLDELPHLRFLHLDKTQVSDNALAAFARLPALELLDLSGTNVKGDNLGALAESKTLRRLDLSETPLDPALLATQPPLNGIESLKLHNVAVDAAVMKWVTRLPSLLSLEMGGPKLDIQSLEFLARSTTLTTLNLSVCDVSDLALEALGRVQSLRYLSLPFNPDLQPEAFAPLGQLKGLCRVVLKGPATRPADLLQSIREFLPGVQVY